jgi:hypothetical protein
MLADSPAKYQCKHAKTYISQGYRYYNVNVCKVKTEITMELTEDGTASLGKSFSNH